jgi:hypothetical protein
VKKLLKEKTHPSLITVGGEPFHISGLEANMRNRVYADIHPILYIYGLEENSEGKGKAAQVANLGELSNGLKMKKLIGVFGLCHFYWGCSHL